MAADAEKLAAIGARIKQLRESLRDPDTGRKLTQTALGQAVHASYRSVQNWEKGVGVEGIKPENIKALADYFRSRGFGHATEDYIEYGVVKRDRPTPSPFPANGASGFATIRTQLARIEDMLAWLVLAEVGPTAGATGASEGGRPPGELGRDLSADLPTPGNHRQARNREGEEKRRDGTE